MSAGSNVSVICSSSSPAACQMCGVRAGTVTRWPGLTTSSFSPLVMWSKPACTAKCSTCLGWTCFAAGAPPGATKSASSRSAPFVSAAVLRNVIRSSVWGLKIVCPATAIVSSFVIGQEIRRLARRRCGRIAATP